MTYWLIKLARLSAAGFAAVVCADLSAPAAAQANNPAGCDEENAPYLAAALRPRADPLMRIAGLQAWTVTQRDGTRAVVMTSDDCLVFEGRVSGPRGEDISAALATTAVTTDQVRGSVAALASSQPQASKQSPDVRTEAARPQTEVSPFAAALTSRRYQEDTETVSTPPWAASASQSPVEAIAAQLPPPASDATALVEQAGTVAMWFQAGAPKPSAPTVYMIADPLCPHCAAAIDALAPTIEAGDIDLRIIPVAIVSQDSFGASISIIQSDDPGSTFVAHELASARSTTSPLVTLEARDHDPDVVVALARNVLWLRANEIPGVPFWLYVTAEGARHGMGPWQEEIGGSALPLPSPTDVTRSSGVPQ